MQYFSFRTQLSYATGNVIVPIDARSSVKVFVFEYATSSIAISSVVYPNNDTEHNRVTYSKKRASSVAAQEYAQFAVPGSASSLHNKPPLREQLRGHRGLERTTSTITMITHVRNSSRG